MKTEIAETAAWTSLEGIAADAWAVDEVIRAALVPVFAQRRSLLGRCRRVHDAAVGRRPAAPCARRGAKGPRLFDWALVATDDPCQVLLIRRLITRPDQLAYFICHVPDPTKIRLPSLATIAGRRRIFHGLGRGGSVIGGLAF